MTAAFTTGFGPGRHATLEDVADPRKAFVTGLAATTANPSTIISWAAIFTAARTADVASSGGSAAVMP